MISILTKCVITGDSFSPKKAKVLTNLGFLKTNEPGEVVHLSSKLTSKISHGSAEFRPNEELIREKAGYAGLHWVLDTLDIQLENLKASGATDFEVRMEVFHDGQCNMSLSPEELEKLHRLGVDLSISCYESPEIVEGNKAS